MARIPDKPWRIAVVINPSFEYARNVLLGALTVSLSDDSLELRQFPDALDLVPAVGFWKPHGIITFSARGGLRRLGVPIVNVGHPLRGGGVGYVQADDVAVGRMGAEYFRQRGFRHLAYVPFPGYFFSHRRWQGFREAARQAGCSCRRMPLPGFWDAQHRQSWSALDTALEGWLPRLPQPMGLMAVTDIAAIAVLRTAQRLGISVPEQLAVLGVDNDELQCLVAHPPLSTIEIPGRQIGAEALAMVCQHIGVPDVPFSTILLPPVRVITRRSSDIMPTGDPAILAAVNFIRRHAAQPIGVADVVRAAGTSRRTLELRFRRELGRTPLSELGRVRTEMARRLLLGSDLKIADVARRCGFSDRGSLFRVFREHVGEAPAIYRQRERQAPDGALNNSPSGPPTLEDATEVRGPMPDAVTVADGTIGGDVEVGRK